MQANLKVLHVVGARPNFMKIAPVMRALAAAPSFEQVLIHTGQHYDPEMSRVFFDDLGLPAPDILLGVGSSTHAQQTAAVMIGFEAACLRVRPDLVLVIGDVNSTLAAALVAAKLQIPSAHLEAGLRSFDRSMPEEINRVVTDHLSELLLTPSEDADANLRAEGIDPATIHRVGNVMIDSLLQQLPSARAKVDLTRWNVQPGQYAVLTMHRPATVDAPDVLTRVIAAVEMIAARIPIVFPVHPRTKKRLEETGLLARVASSARIRYCEPLGYREFLGLFSQAAFVLTDSGGLQEETTALGLPCLTLREHTEWKETVELGSNLLVGTQAQEILAAAEQVLAGKAKRGAIPPLWDGQTGERVRDVLVRWWSRRNASS
jgi:UDP-N-acetylglucosamine 2-epimerase (non-hydrolysing)